LSVGSSMLRTMSCFTLLPYTTLFRSKLFVGNLPWSVGDAELSQIFASHGEVQSARVISDRDSGRSRGFGFVEMDAADVDAVIRRSEEHTSELQSRENLVCRLLLEKKK